MRRTPASVLVLALAAAWLAVPVASSTESLTVESYCAFTVAHLKLIVDRREKTKKGPTTAEEDELFQQFGLSREEYYAFGSEHRQEIEGYLEANPPVRQTIEQLTAKIKKLIDQAERS